MILKQAREAMVSVTCRTFPGRLAGRSRLYWFSFAGGPAGFAGRPVRNAKLPRYYFIPVTVTVYKRERETRVILPS